MKRSPTTSLNWQLHGVALLLYPIQRCHVEVTMMKLTVVAIAAVFLVSCSNTKSDLVATSVAGYSPRYSAEFLELMNPRLFFQMRTPGQEALYYLIDDFADVDLHSTNGNRRIFLSNFFTALNSPPVESVNYWFRIIADKQRSELVRFYAFQAFLLRHVKSGDRLDSWADVSGFRELLNCITVSMQGGVGGRSAFGMPLEGEEYIEIRLLVSIREAQLPALIAVNGLNDSRRKTCDEMNLEVMDLLTAKKKNPGVIITGVSLY